MMSRETGDQFAAIARSLRNEPDELQTLEKALEAAVEVVSGCDAAGITLVQRRHRTVETPAATDDLARRSDQLQLEVGEGPCLSVLDREDIIYCTDLMAERRWPLWAPRVADELGVLSMICFQLFTTQQSIGALNLYSFHVDAFDARDQAVGLALAAHIAVAVAASRDIDSHDRAIAHRTVIGQAEGLLMERYGLSPEQAFTFLKRVSQDSNTKLTDVAATLVRTRKTPGSPA
jgi:GAF domain-containing protein